MAVRFVNTRGGVPVTRHLYIKIYTCLVGKKKAKHVHCRQLTPQQRTHIITHYFKKIIHSTTSTHLACTTLRECQTSTSCTDPCARWVSLADSSSHSGQSPSPRRRPWAKANSFRSGSGSGSHRHPITSCFLPEHNSVTTGERSKKDPLSMLSI